MESLLEKKKADQLTSDEIAELDAIGGLDRIFTHSTQCLLLKMPISDEVKRAIRERATKVSGFHPRRKTAHYRLRQNFPSLLAIG